MILELPKGYIQPYQLSNIAKSVLLFRKTIGLSSNNEKNCTSSFPIVIKKEKNEELDIILQKIIESKKSKKKMSSYEKIYNTFKSIQLSSTKQIEIKRK